MDWSQKGRGCDATEVEEEVKETTWWESDTTGSDYFLDIYFTHPPLWIIKPSYTLGLGCIHFLVISSAFGLIFARARGKKYGFRQRYTVLLSVFLPLTSTGWLITSLQQDALLPSNCRAPEGLNLRMQGNRQTSASLLEFLLYFIYQILVKLTGLNKKIINKSF